MVVVVHTDRDGRICLISARRAPRKELRIDCPSWSTYGVAVRWTHGRVALVMEARPEPGVRHRPQDIAGFHLGALGVHSNDDASLKLPAGGERDGVAGAKIRLGGGRALARIVAFRPTQCSTH